VFRFFPQTTDYHKVLKQLVDRYENIKEIEELFSAKGLSMQARAYIMSLLAIKDKE
jgi:hypothetical protein